MQTETASRRIFLNQVLASTGAVAVGSAFSAVSAIAEPVLGNGFDQVKICDLHGILSAVNKKGGVLVQTASDSYFVFDAEQYDEFGKPLQAGKGVLRLQGCQAFKFRVMVGDAHLAVHPVDFSTLKSFETYEVKNSTWIDILVDGNRTAASKLHHYIITFGKSAFECVVSKLDASISHLPFHDLYAWMLEVSGTPPRFNPGFVTPPVVKKKVTPPTAVK